MDKDYTARIQIEALVKNSTREMLQTIADQDSVLFLKLMKKKKDLQYSLDAEAQERLRHMGILDDTGNLHGTAADALELVRFTEKSADAETPQER